MGEEHAVKGEGEGEVCPHTPRTPKRRWKKSTPSMVGEVWGLLTAKRIWMTLFKTSLNKRPLSWWVAEPVRLTLRVWLFTWAEDYPARDYVLNDAPFVLPSCHPSGSCPEHGVILWWGGWPQASSLHCHHLQQWSCYHHYLSDPADVEESAHLCEQCPPRGRHKWQPWCSEAWLNPGGVSGQYPEGDGAQ
jgi:hypothetical protein